MTAPKPTASRMERTMTLVTTTWSVSLIVHSPPRTWTAEYGAISSPMTPMPASRNATKCSAVHAWPIPVLSELCCHHSLREWPRQPRVRPRSRRGCCRSVRGPRVACRIAPDDHASQRHPAVLDAGRQAYSQAERQHTLLRSAHELWHFARTPEPDAVAHAIRERTAVGARRALDGTGNAHELDGQVVWR